ncbi:LAFE_0F13102g1_1 [Lachancea fermentati]|uniref:LAFE_0F13102g1_1 n=1 Tax=Lachancea fermentati TaxID=4955 RepID=A0A1G4MFN2_LACFM|nr:LAFE_0F13102g1_1 [Lachancea fermentati]
MSTIVHQQSPNVEAEKASTADSGDGFAGIERKDQDLRVENKTGKSEYVPGVSFDTVPSFAGVACDDPEYHDRTLDYTEEEFYDNESGSPERYLNLTPDGKFLVIPTNRVRGCSPPPREFTSLTSLDSAMNGFDGKIFIGDNGQIIRTDYPSRPTIVNDALVLNRSHRDWSTKWQQRKEQIKARLDSPNAYYRFPEILFAKEKVKIPLASDGYTPLTKQQRKKALILNEKVGYPNTPRTIVCHISGRRHTWTALDWVLKRFSKDIDHLVVLTNIPRMSARRRSKSRSRSRSVASRSRSLGPFSREDLSSEQLQRTLSAGPGTSSNEEKHRCFIEWTSGYEIADIKKVLKNIVQYVTTVLPSDRVVKLTVEIVIGKTKKVMLDAMNVYTPDLIVLSSLRWRSTDSLVIWKSRVLTDALSQSFPVPVVIVPVKKLDDFEANLEEELRDENIADPKKFSNSKMPYHSVSAPSSFDSDLDIESAECESFDPQSSPGKSFRNTSPGRVSEASSKFSNSSSADSSMSTSIWNKQLSYRKKAAHEIYKIEQNKDLSPEDKLLGEVDAIIKSSIEFSMTLDNIDKSTDSFVELKKVLTGNTTPNATAPKRSMLDVVDKPIKHKTPIFKIERPVSPLKKTSQIKFAPEVKGKDGPGALGTGPLERTLSYDPNLRVGPSQVPKPGDTNLRKVRSATGLKPMRSVDSVASDTKKKSKGFFSFFKGSDNEGSAKSSRTPSRRNSSASESSGGFSLNSGSSRSKRSSFFGFKKS